ncbi:hypothetical protein JW710_05170 [Candidatus Dojkabacteria bacterium]|nr:hypothetical protein [Candidatus Dojkabacteria bacterium]
MATGEASPQLGGQEAATEISRIVTAGEQVARNAQAAVSSEASTRHKVLAIRLGVLGIGAAALGAGALFGPALIEGLSREPNSVPPVPPTPTGFPNDTATPELQETKAPEPSLNPEEKEPDDGKKLPSLLTFPRNLPREQIEIYANDIRAQGGKVAVIFPNGGMLTNLPLGYLLPQGITLHQPQEQQSLYGGMPYYRDFFLQLANDFCTGRCAVVSDGPLDPTPPESVLPTPDLPKPTAMHESGKKIHGNVLLRTVFPESANPGQNTEDWSPEEIAQHLEELAEAAVWLSQEYDENITAFDPSSDHLTFTIAASVETILTEPSHYTEYERAKWIGPVMTMIDPDGPEYSPDNDILESQIHAFTEGRLKDRFTDTATILLFARTQNAPTGNFPNPVDPNFQPKGAYTVVEGLSVFPTGGPAYENIPHPTIAHEIFHIVLGSEHIQGGLMDGESASTIAAAYRTGLDPTLVQEWRISLR